MEIYNNKPKLIKRSKIGEISRSFKQFFYNQYKKK